MRLTQALWITGLSLVIAPAFAQQKAAPVYEMSADGDIQVATDGHVTDYHLSSQLPPAIGALVDRAVRGWQFEPVIVNGAAVNGKTSMHLGLKAEHQDGADNYIVRITDVRFGEPKVRPGSTRPPRYPESAVSAHVGAKVLLKLRVDGDGKVAEIIPYQTSLDARASSEAEANRYRKMFEEASIRAARNWRFDLTEVVGEKAVGNWVVAPLVFFLSDHRPKPGEDDGKWKGYIPGPIHEVVDASAKSNVTQDLMALKDGEARTLDSRFHLKRDVIGAAL
jgi:hypothetical protein